jgi:hypothetical protein
MTDIGFNPIDNHSPFDNPTVNAIFDGTLTSLGSSNQPNSIGSTLDSKRLEFNPSLYEHELKSATHHYHPEVDILTPAATPNYLAKDSLYTLTALPSIAISAIDGTATERPTGQTQDPGKFRITRTGGDLTQTLTVQYTVSGTAGNGIDYTQLTGFATFAAGASVVDIEVKPIDDLAKEGTESVILTLNADATKYTLGNAKATVNIIDNDIATITVQASDSKAAETAPGVTPNPGVFTFKRVGGNIPEALTVFYTVGGNATLGTDYTAIPTSVTFAAGSDTATVIINPIDDSISEVTENVTLSLATNTNYLLGTSKSATVTIADNDRPTVTVTASDANAGETLTGQTANPGRFTFTRTGDLTSALTANYIMGGTATNGTDYNGLTGTVTFAAGSSTATVNLTPIDDTLFEGNETAILTLAANSNYAIGANNTATVTIADNDKPTITIAATDANATETLTGQPVNPGSYTITRTGATNLPLTVYYTVSGTATNGTDYNNLTGTVTFAAGSSTAVINLNVLDDTLIENNETVILTLAANSNYAIGANNTATVTIADNDLLPTITIAATDANAAETLTGQTANPGQFTITRTGSTANALTVNYTVRGTATNGVDYNNLSGTVTFAAGSSTAVINLNVLDDNLVEGNETVILTLAANSNYAIGANNTATVTIADNDTAPGTLQFVQQYGTSNDDIPIAILNDGYGNTYTLSSSYKVTDGIGSVDSELTKSDGTGQILWTRAIRTPDVRPVFSTYKYYDDHGLNLAFDPNGNILVGGVSQLTSVLIHGYGPNGEVYSTTETDSDGFILKFNHKDGQIIWQDRLDFTKEDIMYDFTTDKMGNSYLVGYTAYSSSIGTGAFIIKYDSLGKRDWIKRIGNDSTYSFRKVVTDSENNIHVVGSGSYLNGIHSNVDVFYVRYDTNGNMLHSQLVAATNLDESVSDIVVGLDKNIYIAGSSVASNRRDVWLKKLAPNGSLQWESYTIQDRNSQQIDAYQGLAVDGKALYVSGTRVSANSSNTILTQALLKKISLFDGQSLWTQTFGANNGITAAVDIALGDGSIYLMGWTTGTLEGQNMGKQDIWYAKFSNDTSAFLTGGKSLKSPLPTPSLYPSGSNTINLFASSKDGNMFSFTTYDDFSALPDDNIIDYLTGSFYKGGLNELASSQSDRPNQQEISHNYLSAELEVPLTPKKRKQNSSLLQRLQNLFRK